MDTTTAAGFVGMFKKSTGKTHIFRAHLTEGVARTQSASLCGWMRFADRDRGTFGWLDARETRIRCFDIGQSVCRKCLVILYKTPLDSP